MAKNQKQRTVTKKPLFVKIIICLLILAFIVTFILSALSGING